MNQNIFKNISRDFSSVIAISVIELLHKSGHLIERKQKDLKEDLLFCKDNLGLFANLNDEMFSFLNNFSDSIKKDHYTQLKNEAKWETEEDEDLKIFVKNIYTFIETSSHNYLTYENRIVPTLIKWLKNDNKAKTIYIPSSSLIGAIEEAKNQDFDVTFNNISSEYISLETIIATLLQYQFTFFSSSNEITNSFDAGLSLPPFGIVDYETKQQFEIKVLEDMLSKVDGRFAIILPLNFATAIGKYKAKRTEVIKNSRLNAVIKLPNNFLTGTACICTILLFEPRDSKKKEILMMDISSQECREKAYSTNRKAIINKETLDEIEQALSGKNTIHSKLVNFDDLERNEYVLDPSRYVLPAEMLAAIERVQKGSAKLEEVAEIIRIRPLKDDNQGKTYLEVLANNIDNAGFIEDPNKEVVVSDNNNALTQNRLLAKDIIFSIKGSVGKVGFLHDAKDNYIAGQSFVIIRLKEKTWTPEYLFRQLKSKDMQYYIERLSTGTFIQSLPIDYLKNLPLIPPTDESIKVAYEKTKRQIELRDQLKKISQELLALND